MEARAPEIRNHANLIWGIAELLRGDYKQADYGKVILPLVVMRRLDQVLEPTRDQLIYAWRPTGSMCRWTLSTPRSCLDWRSACTCRKAR